MTPTSNELSFFDHLEEFRGRLIKSIIAFLFAASIVYRFVDRILASVIKPVGAVVFTYPSEAFLAHVSLTIWGGIILASPVIIYQIWRFVCLALTAQERKYVLIFGPLSLVCFLAGVAFGYGVMIPMSMQFLLSFASDTMVPMLSVNKYISYTGSMVFAFGIVFELPLVLLFLTKIGIATPAFLIQKRKYALVIILIVSAILTPPDVLSQFLMAGPLVVLYEIGIVVSKFTYRTKS
ncbi:MAG: twin arginine-targeting protein translocase TatC [Omnitrophica WOR_2 bacterium RIFCSPHIGHO2_01_FULL_48_9]|nr:MAG: twin arginine-targeting protein translocase TatC [Omnitrophica WOR_2 bacterium RIFCSPHIGHO2_02_FULL_48_11]OGX30092.1 MAG: twin arginine-targeting protein translocase TatC [Omnitrophica WOR_2 bacterium RIFCSPHIGHO2_01_FULL_48_9]